MAKIKEAVQKYQQGMATRSPKTSDRPETGPEEALPYQPKADCGVCQGAGFVHPMVGQRVNYSRVIPCRASGCLVDAMAAYRSGGGYVQGPAQIWPDQIFGTFQKIPGTEQAFKHAKAFADDRADGWFFLVVYGPPGNGKTHLCNAAKKHLVNRGAHPQLITATDLLSQLRVAMNTRTMDTLLEEFKWQNPLILDEVGLESDKQWAKDTLEDLLTARFNRGMPTMMTTNLDWEQFPPRLKSRFGDKQYARVVHNSAPDYRETKR